MIEALSKKIGINFETKRSNNFLINIGMGFLYSLLSLEADNKIPVGLSSENYYGKFPSTKAAFTHLAKKARKGYYGDYQITQQEEITVILNEQSVTMPFTKIIAGNV